jgi:hypothetical protein
MNYLKSGAASAKTVTNIGRILAKKMCCQVFFCILERKKYINLGCI